MSRRYEKTERWEDEDGIYESREYNQGDRYGYARRPPLRRNKIDGMLGGVCAGFGDWVGMDHGLVRFIFVVSLFLTAGHTLIVYFLAWLFISKDNRAPYIRESRKQRRAERKAQRKGHSQPVKPSVAVDSTSYGDVRSKFRSLEERLQDLERSVTSREWKLRRDFRDLES